MREYKFRAWNRMGTEPMVYTVHPDIKDVPNWNADFWEFVEADPDAYIIMQYIGLQDKKGKDIYEGDLIKGVWGYGNAIFEVKWDLYGFRLRSVQDNFTGPNNDINWLEKDKHIDCPMHIDLTKIVGNIYEGIKGLDSKLT